MDTVMTAAISDITAMREQEQSGYNIHHPFCEGQQAFGHSFTCNGPLPTVDVECRTQMAAWFYQIIDFFKFHRETVEITLSYVDRYMQCPEAGRLAMADRQVFQLVCMTALYTAVKIHEPLALDPAIIAQLSRGLYTVKQMEAMELSLLSVLRWRMNPPTAVSFLRCYLQLIPEDVMDEDCQQAAYDMAKFQIELALGDSKYISVPKSSLAFAALLNSTESLDLGDCVLARISQVVAQAAGIDTSETVRDWLYQTIAQQETAMNDGDKQCTAAQNNGQQKEQTQSNDSNSNQRSFHRRSSFDESPRCVLGAAV